MNTQTDDYKAVPRICVDSNILFHKGEGMIIDTFPNATTVFLDNCTPEFLRLNLNKKLFPNLKTFYTNIKPSSYIVMHRFIHNPSCIGYLTNEWYNQFMNKWWNEDTPHIKGISDNLYRETILKYILIEPRFISTD